MIESESALGDSRTYLDRVSRWRVARVIAYEDLDLTIKTIDRYLEASISSHSLVETSIRGLVIKASEADENRREVSTTDIANEHETLSVTDFSQNIPSRDEWYVRVKESLTRFASQLRHMPRIESFSLVLFVCSEPSSAQDSIYFTSISTLLFNLPTTLSSLTIDIGGTPSSPTPERQEGRNHLCSLLLNKGFMPFLRHLRIRTRNICPKIFQSIYSDQHSQLESLIINLSLMREDLPRMSKVFYAHFCLGFQPDGKDLYSHLVDAANEIVPRLPCLKTLKIIRHKYPSEDLASFDVLSDRDVILPPSVDWKAVDCVDDGQTDPDCTERSDDSFSTTESAEELSWLDLGVERTI